jgi:hypothetical protein
VPALDSKPRDEFAPERAGVILMGRNPDRLQRTRRVSRASFDAAVPAPSSSLPAPADAEGMVISGW